MGKRKTGAGLGWEIAVQKETTVAMSQKRSSGGRALEVVLVLYCVSFVVVGLLVLNAAVVSRFSVDGRLSDSTASRVRALQAAYVVIAGVLGAAAWRLRRRRRGHPVGTSKRWLPPLLFWLLGLVMLEGILAVPFPPVYLPSAGHGPRLLLPHDYLGFTLNPQYDDQYRISTSGFRGEPLKTGEVAHRIFCVGDSITFGYELGDEKAPYPVQLEAMLHDSGFNSVDVINAGVPGYGSLNALRSIETIILPLDPDLIVLCVGWNDLVYSFSPRWHSNALVMAVEPSPDRTPSAIIRATVWLGRKLGLRGARSISDPGAGGERVRTRQREAVAGAVAEYRRNLHHDGGSLPSRSSSWNSLVSDGGGTCDAH